MEPDISGKLSIQFIDSVKLIFVILIRKSSWNHYMILGVKKLRRMKTNRLTDTETLCHVRFDVMKIDVLI